MIERKICRRTSLTADRNPTYDYRAAITCTLLTRHKASISASPMGAWSAGARDPLIGHGVFHRGVESRDEMIIKIMSCVSTHRV